MNIHDHEAEAWRIWFRHVCACAEELEINPSIIDDELVWMRESFEECLQLKILYQTGELKAKWEHRCWWADCPKVVFHGDYYCVLTKGPFYHPGKGEEE
jgi:hypothetical protein